MKRQCQHGRPVTCHSPSKQPTRGSASMPPLLRTPGSRNSTEIQTVTRGTLVGFFAQLKTAKDLNVRRRPSCKAPCRCRLPDAPSLPTSLFECFQLRCWRAMGWLPKDANLHVNPKVGFRVQPLKPMLEPCPPPLLNLRHTWDTKEKQLLRLIFSFFCIDDTRKRARMEPP